ncbi:zinc finger, CCHC-type containing protein [Tanacetum coccineum]
MTMMKKDLPTLSKSMTKPIFTFLNKRTHITNIYNKKKIIPDLPVNRSVVIERGPEERLMGDYFDDYYLACVFGVVGANNDINVLDNSPLFDDLLDDKAPVASFVVNRIGFEKGYYLADIIYPEWATFVKSFTVSNDAKHGYFKKRQESARKDVESAFSVLQGRWGKIAQPAQDTNQHHKTADCFGINSQSDYHQMDVKTTFLNGELEEDVYMNQLQGFIIPGNENKVCKLIKFLYGLNEAPKQWQQKFDEVVLSNGYLLNQADKYVYNKFDETSKGVIIFLYVNDMLIFSTDQVQVDLIKKFLSSRFSIKDMGEADVILGIRIKHESNGIDISQSHYIEKVLKKFNYFDCTPVSTPIDTTEKLMPNNGQAVSQLEYSSGWVFLLGGGAISWASKKQTCITALTMESEFMALAAADREAECLRNLILEVSVKPTLEDVEKIYTQHEDTHGFLGMLGSIDCMHKEWKNCQVSWQGQYADANNDINVLDNSSLFDDLLDDKSYVAPFVVNGIGVGKGYYLADGIYPQWANFVKSFTDSDKPKGNNIAGPLVVNMVEHNNSSMYNDKKGKRKRHDNTRANPNKKAKLTCCKCGKISHIKRDCKSVNVDNKANGSGTKGSMDGSSNSLKGHNMVNKSIQVYYFSYVSEAYFVQDDDVAWWVDSGAIVHVCKDGCWFKTYESLNDGSILHMGNKSTTMVHGRGCVDLTFSFGKIVSLFNVLHVPNIRKNLVSSSVLNNCGYKQVIESNKFVLSKHGVFIGFGYLSNHMFMLNIVNDNIGSAFMSTSKLNDSILWHARLGHVHFKRMQDMSKDGLIPAFDLDTEKCKTCMLTKITKKPFQNVKRETEVLELIRSDLCDLHATLSLGNKKYFVTFIDDALRDAIFDEDRLSLVPRPSLRIPNGTEDIGGSVVPEEIIEEDLAFWKEAINNEMDSIMGTTLEFGLSIQVDLTKEFLSSRFSMKDMGEADVILVSAPMDTSENLMPHNGQVVSQLEYSRVIGYLMYAMTCTRPDIAFVVGKLSRYTSNPGTQHWQAIQRVLKYLKKTIDYRLTCIGYPSVLEGYTDGSWINNIEDNSSTSGWVFLLSRGAISWASKKQTCITALTMESEFVALAAAGREAECLRNLILEILVWSKPITPLSILCDSVSTLAKAYSQMYNVKSRHLGVRHIMIRELITKGVISIEFVRSQQNLADHLTKRLTRDLVIKSAEGMGKASKSYIREVGWFSLLN